MLSLDRIADHTARVGVIGLGYVGLPLALTFRSAGFVVTGFDTDDAKVARLNRGESSNTLGAPPALKIIALLRKLNADVAHHDRYCARVEPGRQNGFAMASVPFEPADAAGYDCVAVITDHSGVDYASVARCAHLLVDTRNVCGQGGFPNVVRC